jgi:hypothetical protein
MVNKLRLYVYPSAIPQESGNPLFKDFLPLSPEGIARWCELVPAHEAEYFYCGQFHDKVSDLLVPTRFEFLRGNEHRHIFDIEGDWDDKEIPPWLGCCTITARNALEDRHSHWRAFPTPGHSMLMLRILKQQIEYIPPVLHGFQFRGQVDTRNTRFIMGDALAMARLPRSVEFLGQWSLMRTEQNQNYVDKMAAWSFALCPRGWGHFTMRFYEACALGRYPIVVGNNLWLGHDKAVFYKISPWDINVRTVALELRELFMATPMERAIELGRQAKNYFDTVVRPYYADPTAAFIAWLRETE